jgi:Glycosyltransferase like family 2
VTCLSGRTAVYRRSAVIPVLDGLVNETFMGKKVISGDDKALTLLVQGEGWKVRYQESAVVYTPGAEEMRTFLKQRLRWARNSWRADLKAVSSRWAWRKPLLTVHLIDRLLQPLTTLVAPLYVIYAILQQHWLAVAVVISWWFLSRTIKIWPHLRRGRSSLAILPWYVGFNYWSAVMRIYAFFTMNQQGWITRWNQNRMALLGPLQSMPPYLATAMTIALVAWGVVYKGASSAPSPATATTPPAQVRTATDRQQTAATDLIVQTPPAQIASVKLEKAPIMPSSIWQTPIYSGDGKRIALLHKRATGHQLVIRDVATQKLQHLAVEGELQSVPVWSPDNQKVAILMKHEQTLAVTTFNLVTMEQVIWRPAQTQGGFDGFVWAADSSSIILQSFNNQPQLPEDEQPSRFIAQMATQLGLAQAP